jgi:hypothetical protein
MFLNNLNDRQWNRDKAALESSYTGVTKGVVHDATGYYIPVINDERDRQVGAHGTNWLKWAGLSSSNIDYKEFYVVCTMYIRILPSEFNLKVPQENTPQIWKIIVVNNSVIILAERQTNAHNWLPVLIGQPHEDGLKYQTKSLADDTEGFQSVGSAYMSSILASRRRAISDRLLYDPLRVDKSQINSSNPSAKIPVRPAAYGKPVKDAVYQFPYNEDQNAVGFNNIQQLLAMSNLLTGQNPARQGQFVKGNKTRDEFQETFNASGGRDQLTSILYEAQVFVPLKHILKTNILQFQGTEVLESEQKQRSVTVDPVALRKTVLNFKISDGLTPASKILSTDDFQSALQALAQAPAIGSGYNLAPMFSYIMKTKGADLRPFEKPPEQLAYEQALQSWQNLVSLIIEKSTDPVKAQANLPPQPQPKDFGYFPNPDANQQEGVTSDANS